MSQGRWRLTGVRNASVTPSQARGKELPWAYTVTNADRVVSASFRTTSKAGVAAGTWEQGGGDAPRTWSGTLRGVLTHKNPGGQTTLTSSARVVFELIDPGRYPAATYKVRSGSVQFRITGTTSEGAVTCRASGQASHTLTKADAYLFLMYRVRGSKLQYHAWGADGNLKQTMTTTWTGHPYCASTSTAPVSFRWFSTWDERRRQDTVTSDDLRRLAGTATVVETNITHRWTWDLRAH